MTKSKQNFFGIINVNKPKGFTSHDPMATGVLPVCVGKATKIIQYLESSKAYRAFIKLGVKTDTYDMEGQILEKIPVTLNIEEVKKHLECFKGEITQTPPIYSAVHYKGKRLYEYARKNIEINDIPTRKVTINSIEWIASSQAPRNDDKSLEDSENPVLIIDIDCSEGTYIRSIAYDLGEKLGCGACLSGLIRTKAGKFTLEKTHTLEEIESLYQTGDFDKFLVNPVEILPLEIFEIDEILLEKIKKGQSFSNGQILSYAQDDNKSLLQLVYKNKLAAIARFEDNVIKPVNVFV